MTYQNANYTHEDKARIGVLITNLGTPEAPTAKALRPYLKQFLSDPRVVEIPRLLWWFILNFVILNIRPRRSAKAYKGVWTEQGSPLAIHTKDQHTALAAKIKQRYGDDVIVEWAMRYGQPSVANSIDKLCRAGVQKLFVLPLYPQYSASTTASTFDALAADFTKRRWIPELRFNTGYHTHKSLIDALANTVSQAIEKNGQPEKLLFSYHGIPLRYLHNGDPYHCFCHQTTRLIAEKLNLAEDSYMTVFQSRFGREKWLQPYADKTLQSLAADGVKNVAVICPGFSADCLETIEEIGEENRDYFLEAGGEVFHYIPALNASTQHIDALAEICAENIDDWFQRLQEEKLDRDSQRFVNHSENKA